MILRRALMWDFVLGVGLASIVSALASADEVGLYIATFSNSREGRLIVFAGSDLRLSGSRAACKHH